MARLPRLRSVGLAVVALLLAVAPVGGVASAAADQGDLSITVTVPDAALSPFTVSNAALRWGMNAEAGGGAYFGGCNFLSAGAVGDTGGSRVWTADDGWYQSRSGNATIEKPYASDGTSTYREVPFADRCAAPDGTQVTTGNARHTGATAVITNGTGSIDPSTGTATIAWRGSFTVVGYGGLTSWWLTDPTLTVTNGHGALRATAAGYATSREDTSQWALLPPRSVELVSLAGVGLSGARGFAVEPAYRGVPAELPPVEVAQSRTGSDWGAFPQSLIDFHLETGQAGYWYSTGGPRDGFKPASTVWVSYDADRPLQIDPSLANPGSASPSTSGAGAGTGGSAAGGGGPSTFGGGSGDTSGALTGDEPSGDEVPVAANLQALATILPIPKGLVPALAWAGQSLAWPSAGLLLGAAGVIHAYRRNWLRLPRRRSVLRQ